MKIAGEQEGNCMKVLVTGVKGQLGHDVMNELAKRGYEGMDGSGCSGRQ